MSRFTGCVVFIELEFKMMDYICSCLLLKMHIFIDAKPLPVGCIQKVLRERLKEEDNKVCESTYTYANECRELLRWFLLLFLTD